MNKYWQICKDKNQILFDDVSKYKQNLHYYSFDYFKANVNFFKNNYNLSQDEIDQIMKEIKEDKGSSWYSIDPNTYTSFKENKPDNNGNVCNHKMVPYVGLFETFNHCSVCGQKEK